MGVSLFRSSIALNLAKRLTEPLLKLNKADPSILLGIQRFQGGALNWRYVEGGG